MRFCGNSLVQVNGITNTYYYHAGQRIAMRQGNALYWLLTDRLGSTSMVVAATNALTGELRYKAYGDARYGSGITTTTKYHFTGQREESTIGLYFYNARWYDAALGRFIQADTVVPKPTDPQSLNRYSYVGNNPFRYADPTGHYVDEGNFCLQPGCSYDPSMEYYLLWMAGGTVRVDTYHLTPSVSRAIFGVPVPQRVSQATVVGLSDPHNRGPLLMAIAAGLTGMVANVPMPQAWMQIGAPSSQLPDIYGDPGFGPESTSLGGTAGQLQQAAAQADLSASGQGPRVGTAKHAVFRDIVESWLNPHLRTEQSYYRGSLVRWVHPGSVRLDVVEYDDEGGLTGIYDYKSGGARLSPSRIDQVRANLPADALTVPVIEVRGW
jgi:RHS repeat-associated protein